MNTDFNRATLTYLRKMTHQEYNERIRSLCTENSKSMKRIIRDLKVECMRATPVNAKISLLMQQSFKFRFEEVFYNSLSVKNVMKHYPGLKFYNQLQKEFDRVMGKSAIKFETDIQLRIKNHASSRMSSMSVASFSNNGLCNEAVNALHQLRSKDAPLHTDEDKVTAMAAEMILFISDKFNGEWTDALACVENAEEPPMQGKDINRLHPFISVRGNIFYANCARVFCEQVQILSDIGFYDAVLACYYLHYIFNLKYSTIDEQFFKLFDEVLYNLTNFN